MKPETRKVLERSIDREKEKLMLEQPDVVLHDFLTHASKPEFEKDRTLVPVVRAELVKRMDDRMKAAVELLRETHALADKTYTVNLKLDRKTLWLLCLLQVHFARSGSVSTVPCWRFYHGRHGRRQR